MWRPGIGSPFHRGPGGERVADAGFTSRERGTQIVQQCVELTARHAPEDVRVDSAAAGGRDSHGNRVVVLGADQLHVQIVISMFDHHPTASTCAPS